MHNCITEWFPTIQLQTQESLSLQNTVHKLIGMSALTIAKAAIAASNGKIKLEVTEQLPRRVDEGLTALEFHLYIK
jgi:hypothetical protein